MQNQAIIYYTGNRCHNQSVNLAAQAEETEPTIAKFIVCINAGVNSWEAAGRILVSLHKQDRDVFKRIQKEHPFINHDMLEIFHHIGTRSLYPMTLMLPRQSFNVVRLMPYEKQVKICAEPVEVVTRIVGDKPVVVRKNVAQMTADECRRALYDKGAYTVDHQVSQMTTMPAKTIQALTPKPTPSNPERVPKVIGRYIVRRGVGGQIVFEPTGASAYSTQRVILQEGKAIIELAEYKS